MRSQRLIDELQSDLLEAYGTGGQFVRWRPPGHFYSPIPDAGEIDRHADRIWHHPSGEIEGIDLRADAQLALLEKLSQFSADLPWERKQRDDLQYWYENPNFSWFDAIQLGCMIRHLRPRRLIEVGSGWSSCVTLDANRLWLDGTMECTFVEPYPDLLMELLTPAERLEVRLIPKGLQDTPTDIFEELEPNDILFLDSTHVSKLDSDVNHFLFRVLPVIRPGVWIHIHDIVFPFEYPQDWVAEGRAWNEAYALRAFLMYNARFQIELWGGYLLGFHRERVAELIPDALNNGGTSLWLSRTETPTVAQV